MTRLGRFQRGEDAAVELLTAQRQVEPLDFASHVVGEAGGGETSASPAGLTARARPEARPGTSAANLCNEFVLVRTRRCVPYSMPGRRVL
jgi:hypothetical protein